MTFPYLAKFFSRFKSSIPKGYVPPMPPIPAPKRTPLPRVPQSCFDLIRHFESCLQPTGDGRFRAYPDPAKGWDVPTIGWGTIEYENGQRVKKGDVITAERAEQLFQWEVHSKADEVKSLLKVPVSDNEFGALVSFAYNLGSDIDEDKIPEGLGDSTLLAKLNKGDREGAAREFVKWNRGDGRVMSGLIRRRMSEARLFRGEPKFIVTMEEFKRIEKQQ